MNCYLCGASLGVWTAPGAKGQPQQWRRAFVTDYRGRWKCADRGSCKSRKERGHADRPSLPGM